MIRRSLFILTLILGIPLAVFAARTANSQARSANARVRTAVSQARSVATGGHALVGIPDKMVFALPLEETASGSRRDRCSNLTLTNSGAVTQGTGIQGNCGVFANASSQFLYTAGTATFMDYGVTVAGTAPANSGLTYACWVNATSLAALNAVMSRQGGSANQRGPRILTTSTKAEAVISQDGATDVTIVGATSLTTATWYHLAMVCDLSIPLTTIYVNGVSDASSASVTAMWVPVGMPLAIGARGVIANGSGGASFWNGSIDECRIWTRALSAAEVLHEYAAGVGRAFPDR